MLLAIDIGNTNITLGLYRDQEVTFAWRLATANDRMPDEYGLQLLGLLQHAGCAAIVIEGIALASVVYLGTATTSDAIAREGDYLGGAIAPGIGIASEALFQRTAKLPRVDLQKPPSVIGRNTVHSMQSGLLYGYVGLVEGMVRRFRQELGENRKVIATGGRAKISANETEVIHIVPPRLTW